MQVDDSDDDEMHPPPYFLVSHACATSVFGYSALQAPKLPYHQLRQMSFPRL